MEIDQVQHPTAIVIDASNLCWGAVDAMFDIGGEINRARPPLLGLTLCINYFQQNLLVALGANQQDGGGIVDIVAVAPHWWQNETHMDTDDQSAFEELVKRKKLVFADKKEHDDLVVLQLASKDQDGTYVVSNDKFRDHAVTIGLNPQWYEEHRIAFTFLIDEDDKLVFLPQLPAKLTCVRMDAAKLQPMFFEPEMWALAEPHGYYDDEDAMQLEGGELFEDLIGLTPEQVGIMGLLIGKNGARIKDIQQRFACEIMVERNNQYVIFKSLSLDNLDLARMAFFSLEQQEHSAPIAFEKERPNVAPLDPVGLKTAGSRKLSSAAKAFTPSFAMPVQQDQPVDVASKPQEQPVDVAPKPQEQKPIVTAPKPVAAPPKYNLAPRDKVGRN